jgi:hypothetical protein
MDNPKLQKFEMEGTQFKMDGTEGGEAVFN